MIFSPLPHVFHWQLSSPAPSIRADCAGHLRLSFQQQEQEVLCLTFHRAQLGEHSLPLDESTLLSKFIAGC